MARYDSGGRSLWADHVSTPQQAGTAGRGGEAWRVAAYAGELSGEESAFNQARWKVYRDGCVRYVGRTHDARRQRLAVTSCFPQSSASALARSAERYLGHVGFGGRCV